MTKTAKITIENYKDSDGWIDLATELGYSFEEACEIFEYGEYATLTIEVDQNLNIIGGKINRFK